MENAQTEPPSRPPVRWSLFGLVLLVLAVEAVLLAAFDAVSALRAQARGSAPQFLFCWVLPMAVGGEGRFLSLAKQLILPALAAGLPALLGAWMLALRRRSGAGLVALRPPLAAAAVLLAAGVISDAALYRLLAARPGSGGMAAARPPKEGARPPVEPVGSAPPTSADKRVEKILFTSDRGGQQHLWMMNPDGSAQEQLTKTDRVHVEPRLSPDGKRVAFSSVSAAKKLVACILDLASGQEQEVCEGAQAAFTGDGQGLVLRRDDQIFLRDLGSGAERLISPRMWSRCSYPSASPDGSSVALATRLLAGYNIYILPLAGGEPKLLVGGEGTCDPRWSPGGRKLSYQTESHIFTINPDGSDKLQVSFGGGVQHYACWSPDEKRMAYCQGPGRDGPWQIYTVSLVKDEDPAVLTKEGSNFYPEWGKIVLGK